MVHGKNRIPYWIDRRLSGLVGPDYDATISFGLPIEPGDCPYGKYRPDYAGEGGEGIRTTDVLRAVRYLPRDHCPTERSLSTVVGRLNAWIIQETQQVAPVMVPTEFVLQPPVVRIRHGTVAEMIPHQLVALRGREVFGLTHSQSIKTCSVPHNPPTDADPANQLRLGLGVTSTIAPSICSAANARVRCFGRATGCQDANGSRSLRGTCFWLKEASS